MVLITIISYAPVWKTMREQCITLYELLHRGIDNRTLDTLRKNGNMTLYTLEKICKALDCNPEEVVEFTDDEDNSSERE